jgi:hypothetical protein
MYKIVAEFTRPSVDIPFWQPSASDILRTQENYGFIRNRVVSDDGLTLTIETFAPSEEIWQEYVAASNDGTNPAKQTREAYNAEHGITRTVIFKGLVD